MAAGLERFIKAQQGTIEVALAELKSGQKRTHWMWFVFPQIAGLGSSPTAQFYAIASLEEAQAFLANSVLGDRLDQCTMAVLSWSDRRRARQIFGDVDALKFHSSMTLFDRAAPHDVFADALAAFYDGAPDQATLALLAQRR